MTTLQAEIETFPYVSGKSFTEKLRNVTGATTNYQLADKFGIPRSTIQTWHSHERTAFELIVRTHLATGASVKYLALGEGEAFPDKDGQKAEVSTLHAWNKHNITNGQLVENGWVEVGASTLKDFGLSEENVLIVDQDGCYHFINKNETHPTSGDYLIDIDGSLSINQLQRLPGKKLAIAFGDSTIQVAEEEIKVIGRVAMEMKKK